MIYDIYFAQLFLRILTTGKICENIISQFSDDFITIRLLPVFITKLRIIEVEMLRSPNSEIQ